MKKRKSHTNTFNAKAFFLALLMFTAFGGKEVHILLGHGHSNLEKCTVQAGDTHLHAYEQLEHGCSLCDFTFSFFDLQLATFRFNSIAISFSKKEFPFISFNFFAAYLCPSLRGPPVF